MVSVHHSTIHAPLSAFFLGPPTRQDPDSVQLNPQHKSNSAVLTNSTIMNLKFMINTALLLFPTLLALSHSEMTLHPSPLPHSELKTLLLNL